MSLLGNITQSFTPKYSQGINWRNKFTSVTPENSWGINCVILAGPMAFFEGIAPKIAGPGLRWPDSRESIRRFARIAPQILANRFGVPELNPLSCESRFGGLKTANRRFEAICANRSHVMEMGVFLWVRKKGSFGKGVFSEKSIF